MATGRMLGNGRAATGSVLRRPGRLWPSERAPGHNSGQLRRGALRLPGAALAAWMGGHLVSALVGHLDGQTGRQRAEQKAAGPNAWQGPDGSGAARCGSLGGSGRADGRTPSPAPGGQEDGQACHRRAW